jgi:8-oxo-dGTP pyrophosphatase MutT (NUDIX family)
VKTTELGKVTAYVVSPSELAKLLLFRHPLAGVQLPAGTIEHGEDTIDAARREVFEETGVVVAEHGTILDERVEELSSDTAVILKSITSMAGPLGPSGPSFQRGHRVSVIARTEFLCHVAEREYDLSTSPPKLTRSISGWVKSEHLGSRIRRSFVLLRPNSHADPGSWKTSADGHEFEPFWAPLNLPIELVEGQQQWLDPLFRHLRDQD